MGSQRAASACYADRALGLCGSSSHKTGGASGSPQAGSKEQGPFGQRRAERKTRNPTGGWQPQTVAPQAQR